MSKGKEIVRNDEYRMKVCNFLKIYGGYSGVLVRDGNDKKYSDGSIRLEDVILGKREFKELKICIKLVLECCYENKYKEIEKIMNTFYREDCKVIREKYGNFFDKHWRV